MIKLLVGFAVGCLVSAASAGIIDTLPPVTFMLAGGVSSNGQAHAILIDDAGRVFCSPEQSKP